MHPISRSRLGFPVVLMGTAFLGLAVLTGCDRKEAATATPPAAAPSATAPVSVVSATPAGQAPAPSVMVQADALVSSGTPGHVAAAGGDPGLTYKWYVDNGKIEGAAEGASILWTAGDIGYAHVYCAGASEAGAKTVAMATVKIIQAPSIGRFEANPPAVNPGEGVALGWDAAGATKLILDPGAENVTAMQGPPKAVRPQETTTYTLTATNEAGTIATRTLTVKVVPPPTVKSFGATGAIAVDQPLALVGEFSGGHAEIRKGDEVLAFSDQSPIQATATLKNGDSFTLVVKGVTGSTVSSTRTFSVQGH
ncbi:MAG TPA: hypothetical protein VNV60_07330 [Holophagaceae bacterium]|nr:hypothetical protein [Holophagaceae bacterium]